LFAGTQTFVIPGFEGRGATQRVRNRRDSKGVTNVEEKKR